MDRKFQSSPLTCIFHVTRPYHCSPPCHSLFYFCVSNSAALCERRQAHDDTFSCVSFHGKSTTTTTTMTRISEGCIHQELTKLPKSQNGKRRIKKKRKKRVCSRSLKIFGVSVDETVCDCMYPFLASDVSWLRFSPRGRRANRYSDGRRDGGSRAAILTIGAVLLIHVCIPSNSIAVRACALLPACWISSSSSTLWHVPPPDSRRSKTLIDSNSKHGLIFRSLILQYPFWQSIVLFLSTFIFSSRIFRF